ncbi:MAG TPA: Rrf2 family transcriptional regulator [Crenalkalicoccus sp.]|jgi:Rrf2 family protein|nr:Rrf2 family transcriptional regulator [Crenalkalicoccus sp.]
MVPLGNRLPVAHIAGYRLPMLTQKAKYALRALAVLADADPHVPLPIHEVADRAHAPQKFLESILLELRRHGVLSSTRGKAGGYVLARPPAEVRVGDVIRMVDGPLAPIPCASLSAYRPCADCPEPESCTIRLVMRQVRDATARILDHTTVADLAGRPSAAVLELSD